MRSLKKSFLSNGYDNMCKEEKWAAGMPNEFRAVEFVQSICTEPKDQTCLPHIIPVNIVISVMCNELVTDEWILLSDEY